MPPAWMKPPHDSVIFLFLVGGRRQLYCLHKGKFIPDFRQKGEGQRLFLHLLLELPSAPNNPDAKGHILGWHILMRFKDTVSALKELSVWGMTEGRQVAAVKTDPL